MGMLGDIPTGRRWLVVAAAPKEAEAIAGMRLDEHWRTHPVGKRLDVVLSGVGKANAAAAVASVLDAGRHAGVLSLGIGGALPGSGLALGTVVIADRSTYADEGLLTAEGFLDVAAMGFAPGPDPSTGAGTPCDDCVADPAGIETKRGGVATVSTCSGTDATADEVTRRTGAIVEAMEGAAVGLTVRRLVPELPFAEVRVVSNTTGDRSGQRWDLAGALGVLGSIAKLL
ncbi:MAG: futalosine hydrolase [Planctomycetota bacterium]